ncbi:MAG: ferritin [Candidatus Aminicenantes bacterium]|nr:MAG: ferritin [Candidatus Aminicenantes bacterium]
MIKQKMQDAFNKQINEEMYSSYLYLSMAAYFEAVNLGGFSHWMRLQAQEEMFHAMKFFNHIVERGGEVELMAIKEPQKKWDSALKVYEDSLKHEQYITACINNLMDAAIEAKDYAGQNLLKWFVDEQVEEEDTFTDVLEKLKRIGDNEALLLLQDLEMAKRTPSVNPYLKGAAEAEAG